MNGDWFTETLHRGYGQSFEIAATLLEKKTAFQELRICDTPALGRVLILDGVVQTTEADEFYYHEMMTHPALFAHGDARRVLIIGGGDGGALREVLKHDRVERATVVEIDPDVVALCREHLPHISAGAFDDSRADLVHADGTRFVAETDEVFDVAIVDSTDPVGPAVALFQESFYRDCRRLLGSRGILVRQAGVPFFQRDEYVAAHRNLSAVFRDSAFLLVPVPTYCGGHMALAWASDDRANRKCPAETLAVRFEASGIATRYYTPFVHAAAFALPAFMQAALAAN